MAVWEDHLLLLLTCKDAARLGLTCKALRGVVREHFRDLGSVPLKHLQAALTTFPRARSLMPCRSHTCGWGTTAQREALVGWLCQAGHGADITTMVPTAGFG
jgi:hypothetical protein